MTKKTNEELKNLEGFKKYITDENAVVMFGVVDDMIDNLGCSEIIPGLRNSKKALDARKFFKFHLEGHLQNDVMKVVKIQDAIIDTYNYNDNQTIIIDKDFNIRDINKADLDKWIDDVIQVFEMCVVSL